ncbi:putative acetyltransferase [Paenibacillus konkukensis]|uniref:Acetyltransferase n=1 Tax=Paenibacillus konkukensis TaxID=2020716 RepID=A0ABY4RII1_9BACL|nr:GNAT family N-acetyltransferase [Paenibacillus konkukensis]UQZ81671.1 putative acetyltransferase [Paenibacillus konkukensis]
MTSFTHSEQRALIGQIERLAMHTWPAQTTTLYGPWVLRSSEGITKRANSVWTSSDAPLPEGDWFGDVSRFYRRQGLSPIYHISDISPDGLERYLDQQGYRKEAPCSVMIAATSEVIRNTAPDAGDEEALAVHIRLEHDDDWLEHFLEAEAFDSSKKRFYDRLYADIKPLKGFITLYANQRFAAVGTVVVEEGWAGIINVAVAPRLRGQGIGRKLMNQLALWSREQGAEHMYLQVLDDNEAARKLYRRAGFDVLFGYHYRIGTEANS